MSYKFERYNSLTFATSATTIITPSIDVSDMQNVDIIIANCATANPIVHIDVQRAITPEDSAANTPIKWVSINSTTHPYASAILNTAAIGFTLLDNPYRFIRIAARSTTSESAGFILTCVGGYRRES